MAEAIDVSGSRAQQLLGEFIANGLVSYTGTQGSYKGTHQLTADGLVAARNLAPSVPAPAPAPKPKKQLRPAPSVSGPSQSSFDLPLLVHASKIVPLLQYDPLAVEELPVYSFQAHDPASPGKGPRVALPDVLDFAVSFAHADGVTLFAPGEELEVVRRSISNWVALLGDRDLRKLVRHILAFYAPMPRAMHSSKNAEVDE
jgi:hypothetical protein